MNRTYLFIMVFTLGVILFIGFLWSTILNASASADLENAVGEYIKLAGEGDIEEFYKRIILPEEYFYDANSLKFDEFAGIHNQEEYLRKERDEHIANEKMAVDEFFDLLNSGEVRDVEVMNVRRFDRVGGLVRIHFDKGWGKKRGAAILKKMKEYRTYSLDFNRRMEQYNRRIEEYNKKLFAYNLALNVEKENGDPVIPSEAPALPKDFKYPVFKIEKPAPAGNGSDTEKGSSEKKPEKPAPDTGKPGKKTPAAKAPAKRPLSPEAKAVQDYSKGMKKIESALSDYNKQIKKYNKAAEIYKKRNRKFRTAVECIMPHGISPLPPKIVLPDYENVFFLTNFDKDGEKSWIPLYYTNVKKEIPELTDGNAEFDEIVRKPFAAVMGRRLIPSALKYPRIVMMMMKFSRRVSDERQEHTRISKFEAKLKDSLRTIMKRINRRLETKEVFVEWGKPGYLSKDDAGRIEAAMGRFWDTFRDKYVAKPDEIPDKPIEIKAAYPNIIPSSLYIHRKIDPDLPEEPVGVALKVVFEASRKRFADFGEAIGTKDWVETAWSGTYYVLMVNHVNPLDKSQRWLPVGLDEKYDDGKLRSEIKLEIERRRKLQKK